MNDKIAWYEELLVLEPNSKLFLPLAWAYIGQGRTEDAAGVLKKGLSFHPEHLEARLLLIQCLFDGRQRDAAVREARRLAVALSAHPVFWELWAEHGKESAAMDLALTLEVLARQIKGETVRWGDILELGLKAMVRDTAEPPPQSVQDTSPVTENKEEAAAAETLAPPLEAAAEVLEDKPEASDPAALEAVEGKTQTAAPQGIVARIPLPRPEDIPGYNRRLISTSPAMRKTPDPAPTDEESLSEGQRSYYETRTYAALLADQGELQEALELYTRLLRSSEDDEQRRDLKGRIRDVKDRIKKSQTPGSALPPAGPGPDHDIGIQAGPERETEETRQSDSPPELVQTLTRLAERLEARGQS